MTEQAYLTDVDLARRFAVSRVTIWRWSGAGKFPKPVRLGANCSRWRKAEVEAWEAARLGEDRPVAEGVE
ncbi:helix-turn-helix transcriptional regulator [Ectothiorhodospira shaposhnikovii]|uniref:helix-turn-helix transcriptional regulator n=1 Tax=Ectothiorhodospira shaposhnikovii TaxID=1054 RepID=UPI001EE99E81|nr:AlpA family phage regulatory protein [Ectothiorhodospira shaposhnikovii]MCG5513642.1 AlpA family phage regulatory protein [Ectothiorhodospira shaposhnikovii]